MNNFGLGLILSFTDNATAGIRNALGSLQDLTNTAQNASTQLNNLALGAFSQMAVQMGDGMQKAGYTIISSLAGVISEVNKTGMTLMQAENQLNKLYEGSSKTGKDMLNEISAYAKSSIFDFEQLIPVVTMLKANGIEAFDEIASSTGRSRQTLMDYAADLAAFNPQMRNAYGTGIQAAMGALNEYIAEGNTKSLKSGASLDITALLGEDKGKTIEERSRQVADLLEQLNMVGMTASLANSPMTKLSNMGDTWFQFIGMVSNSGVFDKYNDIITIMADFVNSIPEEKLQAIAASVGGALASLMEPVEKVVTKLVELGGALLDLIAENPGIAKFAISLAGVSGALLLIGGVALKVLGTIGMLVAGMNQLKSIGSIATVMKIGATKMLGALIPLTLGLGLLYTVWKNDLGGIASTTKAFVSNVVTSFTTAKSAVSGSLSDMQNVLSTFDTKNNFFDGLTLAIMRLMVLGKALVEGWNGFTLSEDTFLKAQELGILPLIEALFDLKYRFDLFKEGFLEGLSSVLGRVREFFEGLAESVNGTIFEDALGVITTFFQSLSNNDPEAWKQVGTFIGEIAAKALLLVPVVAVGTKIFNTIKGISGVLGPLLKLVVAHPVVAIIVGVVAALATLYAKSESFRELVSSVIEKVKEIGATLAVSLLPIIQNIIQTAQAVMPQILSAFQKIGQAVAPIIENIFGLIVQLAPVIMDVVGSVFSTIMSLLPTIMEVIGTIADILSVVFSVISDLVAIAVPFIVDIVSLVGGLVSDILPILADLIQNVAGAVTNFLNMALPMLKSIFEALTPVISALLKIVTTIVARLVPVIKSIISIVSNVIKAVIDIIMPILTVVMQVVQAIITVLAPIVEVILQGINFIIDVVMGIIQIVVSVVENIIAVISGAVNFIMSIINTIAQFIMMVVGTVVGVIQVVVDTITGIISAIIGVVQGVWDGIVNVFSNAISFFSGIFTSIFEIVSGVFNSIADFFTTVWNGIVTTFATLGDTISGAIRGAVNSVLGFAVNVINGFIRAINFAIGIINAIPGVSIAQLTELSVPALAKGGIVTQPTTALIGEAGAEAVMPLENNTGWITLLANELGKEMRNSNPITPSVNNNTTNNQDSNYTNTKETYLTTNTTNAPTSTQDDHSITFTEGSIVIYIQSATEEEAERLAQMVMEKIRQKQRVEKVMTYNQ